MALISDGLVTFQSQINLGLQSVLGSIVMTFIVATRGELDTIYGSYTTRGLFQDTNWSSSTSEVQPRWLNVSDEYYEIAIYQ